MIGRKKKEKKTGSKGRRQTRGAAKQGIFQAFSKLNFLLISYGFSTNFDYVWELISFC